MRSIPGWYEWDDEELTPGRKKEGGLHQNLFDSEGKLKGSARFIPDDGVESGRFTVTESVYVPADERRLSPEQQELADFIGEVLFAFLEKGIERAKPHVKRWWAESFRPFVGERLTRLTNLRPRRGVKEDASPSSPQGVHDDVDQVQDVAVVRKSSLKMSAAEAQARYLAAMAARAFSEEQLQMVQNADLIDLEDIAQVQARIAELPPVEVRELMSRMIADASMLGDDNLAYLASALARVDRSNDAELSELPRGSARNAARLP